MKGSPMKAVPDPLRALRWKLALSYSAVTVGALLVVVTIGGALVFSRALIPLDVLEGVLSPRTWIRIVSENAPPTWRYLLSQDPIDTDLVSMMLRDGDLQVTYFDLLQVGDLQVRLRTTGQGSVLLIGPEGALLGTSNPNFVSPASVGRPLDKDILPGLEGPLRTALSGELDADRLFITIEPNERFYFGIPYLDEATHEVLGASIIYFESLPTERDLAANTLTLLGRSALVLLFAAGLVGTFFGFLTARGMVGRLERVSEAADRWSQGDLGETIQDPGTDELGQLGRRLNAMAYQLKSLLRERQARAVSDERNRLARDLHDSAKQGALAASFQIGTALTLFDREPASAKIHLQEAEALVDSVREELTGLVRKLRPEATEGERFRAELRDYVLDWGQQNEIAVHLDLGNPGTLSAGLAQAVRRILQESLANVARHSSARSVQVSLKRYGEHRLEIKDDGVGFDPDGQGGGMGVRFMRERAQELGGCLVIESGAGVGTTVTVSLPAGIEGVNGDG